MAHTKQMPRNPILERLSATMGSDDQERRVPSKPTTKKITKGGKQPCKHLLHKKLKQNSTGGIKSHTDITQDYWPCVRYIDINNLLKAL